MFFSLGHYRAANPSAASRSSRSSPVGCRAPAWTAQPRRVLIAGTVFRSIRLLRRQQGATSRRTCRASRLCWYCWPSGLFRHLSVRDRGPPLVLSGKNASDATAVTVLTTLVQPVADSRYTASGLDSSTQLASSLTASALRGSGNRPASTSRTITGASGKPLTICSRPAEVDIRIAE
jgi:hypothetical protein